MLAGWLSEVASAGPWAGQGVAQEGEGQSLNGGPWGRTRGLSEVAPLAWVHFRYSNQSPLGLFCFLCCIRGSSWSFSFGGVGIYQSLDPASSFSCPPNSISAGFSGSVNLGGPDLTMSSSSSPGRLISHLPSDPKLQCCTPLLFLKHTGVWEPRPPPLHPSQSRPQAPEGAAFCLAIFIPGAFSRRKQRGP